MKKLFKAFRAIGLILRDPWLLNKILEDDQFWKKKINRDFGRKDALPVIGPDSLSGEFSAFIQPFAFGDGGSLPTDLSLLVKIAGMIPGCKYFEIGTWRGESVANVARVAKECYTLNLSDEEMLAMDLPLDYIAQHRVFSLGLSNVVHLQGNTKSFDFASLNMKFDLIFIDGDHHFEMVKNDTQKVFQHLVHDKTIVVWHDYARSPETVRWEVLAGILAGTPKEIQHHIYHVAHTLCAVYLPGFEKPDYIQPEILKDFFQVEIKYFNETPSRKFEMESHNSQTPSQPDQMESH